MAKKATKKKAKRKVGRPRLTEEQKEAKRKKDREAKAARSHAIKSFAAKARKSAMLRKTADDAASVPSDRNPQGEPLFEPTEEQMAQVEMAAGLGLRLDEIAIMVTNPHTGVGIDIKTLKRVFSTELARGPARTHGNVAQSIYQRAIDLEHPQGARMAEWFSKTQMGWHDRHVVEVEVKTGVLVPPPKVSPQDWIEAASIRTIDTEEPGAPGGGDEGNNERAEE